MNTNKILFTCIALLAACFSMQAREPVPQWAINEPVAPVGANYIYISGMGIGNTETEAINNAWDDALRKSMSRSGLLEFSTEGVEVLRNRVARQMRCQTPAIRLPNGQVRVYVLFQMPIRASDTVVSAGQHFDCRDEQFERDLMAWHYGRYAFSPRVFVPGMAQFYKGSRGKGVMFISAQAVTIGGVIVAESLRATNASRIGTTHDPNRRRQYIDNANMFETARNVAIAGAAAVYVWNVIDGIAARGRVRMFDTAHLNIAPVVLPNGGGVAFALNF